MKILTAFAPFIAFAVFDRLIGSTEGLAVGAAVSAILVARDLLGPKRSLNILEFGTALLFAGLTLWSLFLEPNWSVIGVRLRVDSGLLLVVLGSIAVRKPFTLQYAREEVPREAWSRPEFLRANYVISSIWAAAFAVMVAAEAAMLYVPDMPQRVGVITMIVAIVGAMKFSAWYPQRLRSQAGPELA